MCWAKCSPLRSRCRVAVRASVVGAADGVLPEAVDGNGTEGFFDGVDAQAVGVAPLVTELAVDPVGQDAALADRHLQQSGAQRDAGDVAGRVRQNVGAADRMDGPNAGGHRQRVVNFGVQADAADRTRAYAAAHGRYGIGSRGCGATRGWGGSGRLAGATGGQFTSRGEFAVAGSLGSGEPFSG